VIDTVVDSAGYGKQLGTGLIATVFGSNLAAGTASAAAFPLPHEMAGTQVLVDGQPSLLYYVSPNQINFIIPPEGGQTVTVVRGGATTSQVVTVGWWAPGLFTLDSNPTGPLAAEHLDGSIVTAKNPAHLGETIAMWGTGMGVMNPLILPPIAAPFLQIGGKLTFMSYFGNAPGIPGVSQFNVVIPSDAPVGDAIPVVLQFGGLSNAATLAIAK
jgi:uncharacterized protein (TIGR03437 family)